ncbi:MAG: 2OG-Fe(II) oxygenase [Candidatus Angelobacter sp.]|nr:2OG-Fe(II) oxygenase [Candidatus Angelobacter sp.]
MKVLPSSRASKERFRKNGYLVVDKVIPSGLRDSWKLTALRIAQDTGRSIRKEVGNEILRYRVVTGETIRDCWPELYDFYSARELRSWISEVTGTEGITLSSHLQSAININVLNEPGEVYRWHFDAEPYTALLYLSDSEPADGGCLEFYPNANLESSQMPTAQERIKFRPRCGSLVLMDGTRCYHRVSPILRRHERVSIPMVFPAQASQARPENLDSYLYDQAA